MTREQRLREWLRDPTLRRALLMDGRGSIGIGRGPDGELEIRVHWPRDCFGEGCPRIVIVNDYEDPLTSAQP